MRGLSFLGKQAKSRCDMCVTLLLAGWRVWLRVIEMQTEMESGVDFLPGLRPF
jgi:hypothetical protein